MVWRWFSLGSLLVVYLGTGGCGGDGSSVPDDPVFQRLEACATDGTDVAGGVFDAIFDLFTLLEDPAGQPPDNVIFDPEPGNFSIGADLDGDGFTEAVVEGTLSTSSNLDDGFDPGESIELSWQIGVGVPVSGTGVMDVTLESLVSVRTTGWLTVSGGDLCTFEVTGFDFTMLATAVDRLPTGTMEYSVTSGTDSMSAVMVFNGTKYVQVTAYYDGQTIRFTLDLETGQVV